MDKELQVPEFVNERYYQNKYQESKKTIRQLKIYNKAIKLIAFGAVLVLAGTNPKIQNIFDVAVDKFIEYDNQKFNEEQERNMKEIEDINNRTIEDITEQAKSIR